jgi:ligand-binding sensor domain-containing protein
VIAVLLAALYTNTLHVNGIAVHADTLWAATAGGVEEYELPAGSRTRLFTTADGLDANHVLRVWHDGVLRARTARSVCSLTAAEAFTCAPAEPFLPSAATVSPLFHGARVTGTTESGGKSIVATDGAGLWLGERLLTPGGQLCGNHVQALAEFRGMLWVGTFDAGLCTFDGNGFRTVAAPFRMVNDLRSASGGLFVAAAEGLFVTRDGRTFRRETRVRERGVNRIAASRRWLFVTTPFALHALRIDGQRGFRRWPHPAGSKALQAVTVSDADLWLASEDSGAIRLRRGRFEAFDRASGLPSSWAVDVAPAPGGGVWVATLRDGAVRLSADGNVRQRLAPGAWGLRLYADAGAVLFGTQNGIIGVDVSLPDPCVHALLRSSDALFIGTESGLVRTDRAPLRLRRQRRFRKAAAESCARRVGCFPSSSDRFSPMSDV